MTQQPKLEGTHLLFDHKYYIKVKTEKIKAEKIRPMPAVRYGVKQEDGKTILPAKSATVPKFRENQVEATLGMFEEDPEVWERMLEQASGKTAEEKRESLSQVLMFGFGAAQDLPLSGYSRIYIDQQGDPITGVTKFVVVGVNDDGSEKLNDLPYVKKTQVFPIDDSTVYPLIYLDQMLQARGMQYELFTEIDTDRFALWERIQKMFNWVKSDGTEMGEVMAVIQPVYMQGGQNAQEYIALIWPKRVTDKDGTEKFVLVMRLSQSNLQLLNAMIIPKPGEVPITVSPVQAPMRLASFDQMKAAMAK